MRQVFKAFLVEQFLQLGLVISVGHSRGPRNFNALVEGSLDSSFGQIDQPFDVVVALALVLLLVVFAHFYHFKVGALGLVLLVLVAMLRCHGVLHNHIGHCVVQVC
jgi:hypothetical protein